MNEEQRAKNELRTQSSEHRTQNSELKTSYNFINFQKTTNYQLLTTK